MYDNYYYLFDQVHSQSRFQKGFKHGLRGQSPTYVIFVDGAGYVDEYTLKDFFGILTNCKNKKGFQAYSRSGLKYILFSSSYINCITVTTCCVPPWCPGGSGWRGRRRPSWPPPPPLRDQSSPQSRDLSLTSGPRY